MAKLLTADLMFSGDNEWECDIRDIAHTAGILCSNGLEDALGEKFDTTHKYQLRIYDQKPRCETTKLYLMASDHSDERIANEEDKCYAVDLVLVDVLDSVLGNTNIVEDEEGVEWKVFYARAIKKGKLEQNIQDGDFDVFNEELTVYTGSHYARIRIDFNRVEWIANE